MRRTTTMTLLALTLAFVFSGLSNYRAAANEPAASPYEGWPLCADHDPDQWHSLVDEANQCHYDHEHKDDPRLLDGIFGPVGEAWGGATISYPWQTHSGSGSENALKHRVYGWSVIQTSDCQINRNELSLLNLRTQLHADGRSGATVRFHSFYLQAEACSRSDPGWRGTISLGGHQDYGYLQLFTRQGFQHVPLAGDPETLGQEFRTHPGPDLLRAYFGWYGQNSDGARDFMTRYVSLRMGFIGEVWGPVNPDDPTEELFYGGAFNGSRLMAHQVRIYLPPLLDILDGERDGYVTYSGFTDRFGTLRFDCTELGTDCIPLELDNMKPGYYTFTASDHGLYPGDHDVTPEGETWILYPN